MLLSSYVKTWEYLVLPSVFSRVGYLQNFVSQIRCAARQDNVCLLSHLQMEFKRKSLFEIFAWERIRAQSCIVTLYRIPFFHAISNTMEFVYASDVLAFFNPLPPSYISSRRSSAVSWNSRSEWWQYMKYPWKRQTQQYSIFQVETLPYRREILTEILSADRDWIMMACCLSGSMTKTA